jgi:hypothetical protein
LTMDFGAGAPVVVQQLFSAIVQIKLNVFRYQRASLRGVRLYL